MPSVSEFRQAARRREPERPKAQGGYYDPEALIEQAHSVEAAFEKMANAETNNAMRSVYLEMAAAFRRAVNDAYRTWRDTR